MLGAIGNGNGRGTGQFLEASYFVMDSHDNIWTGDTARGRITEMIAPKNQNKNQKMRAAGQRSGGGPRT